MRQWLALSLLCLVVGCREKATDWGPTCKLMIDKITEDCTKFGTKGDNWKNACSKYLEGIKEMKSSLPGEGTFKEKVDEADTRCNDALKVYNDLTKNPQDFPRN